MTKRLLRRSLLEGVFLLAGALTRASEASEALPGLWDYSSSAQVRSYPFGGRISGEAGYSLPLWGEKRSGEIRYGFLRAWGRLSSSGVVNRGDAQIDLHPISFVTLGAGYGQSVRSTEIDGIDCAVAACRGGLGGPRLAAALMGGAGPFAAGGSWTRARLIPSEADREFADESSNLTGAAGGDSRVTWDAFVAAKATEAWTAALYYSSDKMIGAGSSNSLKAVMVRQRLGSWSWSLGTGAYSSTQHSPGVTFFGQLKWTGSSSLALD